MKKTVSSNDAYSVFGNRISKEMFERINKSIHKKATFKKSKGFEKDNSDPPENKSKLLVDATLCPG
jgi:hypothetical protein